MPAMARDSERPEATAAREGEVLWTPPPGFAERSRMGRFLAEVETARGTRFDGYDAAWRWSVDEPEAFWGALWRHFDVAGDRGEKVLGRTEMPGAEWFPGTRLSYVENLFRQARAERPALVVASEGAAPREVSWAELEAKVAAAAAALAGLGVASGDRVAGYLPNGEEALVAFLATASLGAIWTCCSPDFGAKSAVDRLRLVEPKVLVAVEGYRYGGKAIDRSAELAAIRAALPALAATVLVASPARAGEIEAIAWEDLLTRGRGARLETPRFPFEHPLWILYSSGTTGPPKAIVQSQGGILLEHLKSNGLHLDLGPDDRFFWFSTTGWMMWNKLVGGLLVGSTVVLYDGNPGFPDLGALWRLAADVGISYFGASAAFLDACRRAGVAPRELGLERLRALGSTGSPLSPAGFAWVYREIDPGIWLQSVSGGTDVCTAFVGACPYAPVKAGELQRRCLGAKVEAFDEAGRPLVGEVGELVLTAPMPSMPVRFWNDPDDARYRESYFDVYPGVWRHGDWIKITPEGGAVLYGRSDATLNRHGVRMGSAEIYAVVEAVPGVVDSLVVDVELAGRSAWMGLFVVPSPGRALDAALDGAIRAALRRELSPRHVPDAIVAVAAVPKTLNGKKLEIPVKKILGGRAPEQAANLGSVADPEALRAFVALGERLRAGEL